MPWVEEPDLLPMCSVRTPEETGAEDLKPRPITAGTNKHQCFQTIPSRGTVQKSAVLGTVVTKHSASARKVFRRLFPASEEIAIPSNRKPERKTASLLRTHLPSKADSK